MNPVENSKYIASSGFGLNFVWTINLANVSKSYEFRRAISGLVMESTLKVMSNPGEMFSCKWSPF